MAQEDLNEFQKLMCSDIYVNEMSGCDEKYHKNPIVRIPNNKTQLKEVLLFSNPWAERELKKKLEKLETLRQRSAANLEWSQRRFFVNQVFDANGQMRYTQALRRYREKTNEFRPQSRNASSLSFSPSSFASQTANGRLGPHQIGVFCPPIKKDLHVNKETLKRPSTVHLPKVSSSNPNLSDSSMDQSGFRHKKTSCPDLRQSNFKHNYICSDDVVARLTLTLPPQMRKTTHTSINKVVSARKSDWLRREEERTAHRNYLEDRRWVELNYTLQPP